MPFKERLKQWYAGLWDAMLCAKVVGHIGHVPEIENEGTGKRPRTPSLGSHHQRSAVLAKINCNFLKALLRFTETKRALLGCAFTCGGPLPLHDKCTLRLFDFLYYHLAYEYSKLPIVAPKPELFW